MEDCIVMTKKKRQTTGQRRAHTFVAAHRTCTTEKKAQQMCKNCILVSYTHSSEAEQGHSVVLAVENKKRMKRYILRIARTTMRRVEGLRRVHIECHATGRSQIAAFFCDSHIF